ncbi:hypothetical protein DIPPA_00718 [Diplonema papillatum]|nr:hypothetical protein DIPPA_00718 [Diplonema papillatum]
MSNGDEAIEFGVVLPVVTGIPVVQSVSPRKMSTTRTGIKYAGPFKFVDELRATVAELAPFRVPLGGYIAAGEQLLGPGPKRMTLSAARQLAEKTPECNGFSLDASQVGSDGRVDVWFKTSGEYRPTPDGKWLSYSRDNGMLSPTYDDMEGYLGVSTAFQTVFHGCLPDGRDILGGPKWLTIEEARLVADACPQCCAFTFSTEEVHPDGRALIRFKDSASMVPDGGWRCYTRGNTPMPQHISWAAHVGTRYVRVVDKVDHKNKTQIRAMIVSRRPWACLQLVTIGGAHIVKRKVPFDKIKRLRVQEDLSGVPQILVSCEPPEHDMLLRFIRGTRAEAVRASMIISTEAAGVGVVVPLEKETDPGDLYLVAQLQKLPGYKPVDTVFGKA